VTALEVAAFAMALAMVVFNVRVHPAAWPLAIASSAVYGFVFWEHRLYGEATLQLLFIAMAGWGWWQWVKGRGEGGGPLVVRSLSRRGRFATVAAIAVAWPAIGFVLAAFTDSDVPWWDAFPTAASIVGTALLARKYVENWPVWIAVNVVAIGLFVFKGLWLTTVLYALFVVLSIVGWIAWRRLAARQAARA
jgi:nicotinamide mononucleotide transporter